jgi:hypothetical protein
MASSFVDLVKIKVTSFGTGALTLGSAVPGYRGVEVLTNGSTYGYSIQQNDNFEYGTGTYLAATQQLIRTPLGSSNGGTALNLTAGTVVSFVVLAEDLTAIQQQISQQATVAAAIATAESIRQAVIAQGYAANAATSATGAAGSASSASTALSSISSILASSASYPTKAAANAALSGLAANAFAQVWVDESLNNRWTIYQKVSGAYVFVTYAVPSPLSWDVDPKNGSDSNAGTQAAPFLTIAKAASVAQKGDTIWMAPNAVVKNASYTSVLSIPDGVHLRSRGGTTLWQGFDKVTGSWTNETGAYYKDITHLFGGASSKIGANRLYPLLIYRTAAGQPWQQVKMFSLSDYANDAAGIAAAKANLGYCYVQDNSAGGSCYANGYQQGSFRYHVNLGADPSGYQWMVLQRGVPNFGVGSIVEDQIFFGCVNHDGLVASAPMMRRCEIHYPGSHASEMPGCVTEDCTFANGRLGQTGYGAHNFGNSANYSQQLVSRHIRPKFINWPGAIIGCHGTSSADGGGGAGVVIGRIVMEDPYFENVSSMGNGDGILSGITLINPVFYNTPCDFSGMNANIVVINPRLLVDSETDVYFGSFTNAGSIFTSPATGYTLTVIGGTSAGGAGIQGFIMAGGAINVSKHRMACGFGGTGSLVNTKGTHQGLTITGSVIQVELPDDRTAIPINYAVGGAEPSPININGSHLSGFTIPASPYVVNVDEHSYFGGDTGISRTDNPNDPVQTADDSTWFMVGERLLNLTGLFSRNMVIATSKGLHLAGGSGANIGKLLWAVPSGFTMRGIAGTDPASPGNTLYAYGLGGKVYFNTSGDPANLNFTALSMGATTNYVSHLIDGTNLFLFGDDGSITKIVTSTNTISSVTSPIAGAGNKIRGGLVVSTGANMIAYWAKDDESAGGIIYSTNGGTTWTANATSGLPKTFRCAALVNSVIVVAGDDHQMWTCATVGGTFVQLTASNVIAAGSGNFVSLMVDATRKLLGFVTRGTANMPIATRYATKQASIGWVDCTNATPANWVLNGKTKPIRSPLACYFNSNLNPFPYAIGEYGSYAVLGAGLHMAEAPTITGTDYRFSRARGAVPYALRSPDIAADLAYTLS